MTLLMLGLALAGPLKQLAAIRADADLETFTATINHRPIHSAAPVQVSLRDGRVELKQVRLAGQDMNLLANGTSNNGVSGKPVNIYTWDNYAPNAAYNFNREDDNIDQWQNGVYLGALAGHEGDGPGLLGQPGRVLDVGGDPREGPGPPAGAADGDRALQGGGVGLGEAGEDHAADGCVRDRA